MLLKREREGERERERERERKTRRHKRGGGGKEKLTFRSFLPPPPTQKKQNAFQKRKHSGRRYPSRWIGMKGLP